MKVSKLSLISIITFIALSLVFTISGTAQDSSAVQTQAVEATAAEAGAEHVATEPAHEEHAAGEEKLNAGKLIMEHIADSHGWHLWGHTSIPLPVIV